jgi:glycosyltransferase involved in cell wall biosynthesis
MLLTRYHEDGASSRLRMLQYRALLESSGFKVLVSPFFYKNYVADRYANTNNRLAVLMSFARRICALVRAWMVDIVWVEQEVFPLLPGRFETLIHLGRAKVVVDTDDAMLEHYRGKRGPLGGDLTTKLRPLYAGASAVTAGNSFLAVAVSEYHHREIVIVPTVVDPQNYIVSPPPGGKRFRIGWIGTPSTARYLRAIRLALSDFSSRHPMTLVTIGIPNERFDGVEVEAHSWSQSTERVILQNIHVGIMPLIDGPSERGKCGYKLIQYMACGRPVVGSPVGVNSDIVSPDVGRLAGDHVEWVRALEEIYSNEHLRNEMGVCARRKVEREFSLDFSGRIIVDLFKRLTQKNDQRI